ncbi:MAG: type II secretion system protein [Rhodospirillaceae bacterium]|nr:type II secretion system protein [Rhodospirillaceae bacterium]
MWVYWTPTRSKLTAQTAGFTLLEVLVVVFIMGLTAAVIAPNFPGLFDRISFSNQKETLFRQINTLPYSAYGANQDLVLDHDLTLSVPASLDGKKDNQSLAATDLGIETPYRAASLKQVKLDIPDGWEIRIPQPIFYRASGFCTGGQIKIFVGSMAYEFGLAPPYCQITQ